MKKAEMIEVIKRTCQTEYETLRLYDKIWGQEEDGHHFMISSQRAKYLAIADLMRDLGIR